MNFIDGDISHFFQKYQLLFVHVSITKGVFIRNFRDKLFVQIDTSIEKV